MMSVLGVDVGGTKIAAGPVDRAGNQLASPLFSPSHTADTKSFLAGLEDSLRQAMTRFAKFAPKAVGLACAGTVDMARGVVVTSPNLPLTEVPVASLLQAALGVPVVLDNDANAAVLGEAVAGAARGLRNVVMLALGTGVGGGLFLDGRVYRGASGGAGELGHIIVQKGGLPCRCGSRGCLEMYASGPALARYANAQTGEAVAELARRGDPEALEAVRQLAEWLGVGLTSIANTFDPDMIVVGGGVSGLGELLLHPAREYMRKAAMPPGRDRIRVVSATLGNKAGLVGAALTAWELLERADPATSAPR
jgi:glucokinase